MAVLDVWDPPTTEELSILPNNSAPNRLPNPLKATLNTIDFFGSLAGSLVGVIADGVNRFHDLIDSKL